jgi:hypothetical protein
MEEFWFLNPESASGLKLNLSCACIKSPISDLSCRHLTARMESSRSPAGKLKNDVTLKKNEQFAVL